VIRADKLEQVTFVARMSAIWVTIVYTGYRILKGRFALPWRTNGPSVASFLDEVQLIFEEFENIAPICCHGPNLLFLIKSGLASVSLGTLAVGIPTLELRKKHAT
jgi:hypothetical protein